MDTKKVIGNRINEALAFSNKKQKELAAHLGVPDNTISYFCSGKRVPNAEQIIEISKFLGVSSDFLLGLSDNKTTEPKLKSACEYTGLNEEAIKFLHDFFNGLHNDSPNEEKEKIKKYTGEVAKLASEYIVGEYFFDFLECIVNLEKQSKVWLEEYKKGIKFNGEKFQGNDIVFELEQECDIATLYCSRCNDFLYRNMIIVIKKWMICFCHDFELKII